MNKVIKSLVWKVLQQYSSYILKLLVQIILARILIPEEFGIIAEISVFLALADTIANNALGVALVRKGDADEMDFSTAFYGSLLIGSILYLCIFLGSPFISRFLGEQRLTSLLRVNSISIFLSLYLSILNAFVIKNFQLHKNFISSLISSVISGVIAVILAYAGFGVWALVFQNILLLLFNVIILQMMISWKPQRCFRIEVMREMFSFSWKYMLSALLGSLLENTYNLSIGKFYGNETLGYYNRGNTFPGILIGQVRIAFNTILLPVFSERQRKQEILLESVKKATHISVLVVFPLVTGMIAAAEPLVEFLLTDKWLPSVFFLRIECIFYAALSISTTIGCAITAVGRSDILAKTEFLKLLMTIMSICFFHTYNVKSLCLIRVVIALIAIIYTVKHAGQLIGYHLGALLHDIKGPFLLSVLMGIIIYPVNFLNVISIMKLAIQVCVGILVYMCGIIIFMKKDIKNIRAMAVKQSFAKGELRSDSERFKNKK